jgi:chemotaxis protein MotA
MKIDFATLAGLIFGVTIVGLAIASGSDFKIFLNLPGFMIVAGGTLAATMIKYPITGVFISMPVGFGAAFTNDKSKAIDYINLTIRLVKIARKSGLQALEGEKIDNLFYKKGIQLCADGKSPEFIRKLLTEEITQEIRREEVGANVFRSIGDSAPAFGMFGTLVGLIQMLADMTNPATIGPAMAVAMLTTLYGVLIAQLIAYPISEKLLSKISRQQELRELLLECVIQIQGLQNPTTLFDILEPYLPGNVRASVSDSANEKT